MSDRLLVFDMDGVLVDVTESYRETIQRTVEHFTGRRISRPEIQDWKTAAAGMTTGRSPTVSSPTPASRWITKRLWITLIRFFTATDPTV